MFGKKKKKKDLKIKSTMPNHVNLVPKMKEIQAYKKYRVGGGEVSFEDYKKGKR